MSLADYATGALVMFGSCALIVAAGLAVDGWKTRNTHHCALCDAMATRPTLLGPFTQAEVDTLRHYEHELTGVKS